MIEINPELSAFVEIFPKLDLQKDTLDQTRTLIASFAPKPLDPNPTEFFVPSLTDADSRIRALKYSPEKNTPCPVMIQFHGGGFVLGAAEDSHFHNHLISSKLGITVIAVDYRLAPENPYPAAIEDGHSVVSWVLSHADELEVDPEKLIISGESAGGGIAASLAHFLGQETEIGPTSLQLIYPMLDPRSGQADMGNTPRHIWTAENNNVAWDMYAPNSIEDIRSNLPIASIDLTHFPPTAIYVGTADLFHNENQRFSGALKEANVETDIYSYEGGVHGFPMAIGTQISAAFWEDYLKNIEKHLS